MHRENILSLKRRIFIVRKIMTTIKPTMIIVAMTPMTIEEMFKESSLLPLHPTGALRSAERKKVRSKGREYAYV